MTALITGASGGIVADTARLVRICAELPAGDLRFFDGNIRPLLDAGISERIDFRAGAHFRSVPWNVRAQFRSWGNPCLT